ncbi:helix-turn-helix domain-containing protein [Aetokthonos hydrillicola]|uniref:helix-turn-helix domain-containing protein n=1 Tax=Aetokthonos hydrillicola TaxID=1550245 RepID=UPI001FBA677A|nr:helix-turn-helix domain-containing protein [Aetokthonos hydrillicola]
MELHKIEIDRFVQQAQKMYRRLAFLYQNANATPLKPDLMPEAFKELGSASEIVMLATEELYQQNEELVKTRSLIEAERQRYVDLFDSAPDGYLVTDLKGVIQEANIAATKLLNQERQFILGKPVSNFMVMEDRHRFRSQLTQLSQSDKVTELTLRLQQGNGKTGVASVSVAVGRDLNGVPLTLRWLLRCDGTQAKPDQLTQLNQKSNLTDQHTEKNRLKGDRPSITTVANVPQIAALAEQEPDELKRNRVVHKYSRCEIIPNDSQAIWYVSQGCVKLSTICETGEEIMIGLAIPGTVFGSDMTQLKTYQAAALSDVELVSIYLAEISSNPILSHMLLPKIKQHVRQTQSLLVVSNRRRVSNRLNNLLEVFKQDIGEPCTLGTRLSVRLTHEDLASACGTTRVTMTRLLKKLQQQGKISFDDKKHIIINNLDELSLEDSRVKKFDHRFT